MHRLVFLSLVFFPSAAFSNDTTYLAGTAKIDITPHGSIRLSGYRDRPTESEGVEQRLWAKALALGGDGEALAILMTVENVGVPATVTDEVAARLKKKADIARERFVVCSTHTHTAPCLTGVLPNIFGRDIPAEHQQRIDQYTRDLIDKMEEAALAALSDRQPARLAWGQGKATFAINRRTPGGPVDHAMPLLRVTDAQGKLRAVVANYACHCAALGAEFNKVCGDWAGYAQEYIEHDHPDAVALVTIGCGGDQNPEPRPGLEFTKAHGHTIADETKRLLGSGLKPLGGALQCRFEQLKLPFDTLRTRAEWEDHAAKRTGALGYQAKKVLAAMDRGEAQPDHLVYPVQTWNFGDDLAMVFLGGEVVIDYSLRLKKEYDPARMWVTAYANDVPCYIPSRRVWTEGGYEGGGAMAYYNLPTRLALQTEDRIIAAVHKQLPASFLSEDWHAEFPPPKSPAESLACIKTKPDLTVELVAAEPLIADPVDIHFAADGKLWVVEMTDYPVGTEAGGRVKYLEDIDNDGKYDKATTFLDGLKYPTGVMTWKKGALICVAPDLIYAEDIDGDGKADTQKKLLSGFSTKTPQYQINSLTLGLDNWIYGASQQTNAKIHNHITGKDIPLGHRDFRFNLFTNDFEPVSGASQYGRTMDDWGNWFGCDNSSWIWHFPLPDHYVRRNPHVASLKSSVYLPADPEPDHVYPISRTLSRFNEPNRANRVTSACSPAIYRDELLGSAYTGNAFICEPVHNLVHRLVLEPKGATFAGHRPADEQNSEFLASTDNWFRPAQVRTGPDGALWIVDMYRFVVEHPQWIPEERLAQLDVRAGSDKGRIYRVYPKHKPPRPIRNLTRLTTPELAAALDSPNGTEHDLIRSELLHRADSAAVPVLTQVVKQGIHPSGRLQALCTLDGLNAPTKPELIDAVNDPHPGVRRNAIRLSEPEISRIRMWQQSWIRDTLYKLEKDHDPGVRFQLALSLAEWREPPAAEMLGRLAASNLDDPWLTAAVLTSAMNSPVDILNTLLANAPDTLKRTEMIKQLIAVAAGLDRRVLERALPVIAPQRETPIALWHLQAFDSVLKAMNRNNLNLSSFESSQHVNVQDAVKRLNQLFAKARLYVNDGTADEAMRLAAISITGHIANTNDDDLQLLGDLLAPQTPPNLQTAAINALAQTHSEKAAALLLSIWKTATPSLRTAILDALLSRSDWIDVLLNAIEAQDIQPAEIDVVHREKLLKHLDADIQKRSAELLAAVRPVSRTAAIEQYRSALTLKGDPAQGAAVFAKSCTSCHAFNGQGHHVGPDLVALTDKSPQALLTGILDPNAAKEAKFTNYMIETTDGRSLTGIIISDTATSMTLLQSNGIRESILRKDIESIRSSTLSLMPEGLEEGYTPQQMADLIAYLRSPP